MYASRLVPNVKTLLLQLESSEVVLLSSSSSIELLPNIADVAIAQDIKTLRHVKDVKSLRRNASDYTEVLIFDDGYYQYTDNLEQLRTD